MAVLEAVRSGEIEALRSSLAEHALKLAPPGQPFVLASGKQSHIYFDTKPVTLSPECILPIGRLFWEQAQAWGVTAIGGLAAGAIPVAMAAVAYDANEGHLGLRAFYIRDARKDHGTKEALYQAFDPASDLGILDPIAKVLIVDDVLTTGSSIMQATEEVIARGGHVRAIAVLVDRREGGAAALREKYSVPVVAIFTMDTGGALTFCGQEVF